MSRFTDLTDWREPVGSIGYATTKPVEWEIGAKGSGLWLRVPPGFRFDVSIPRALWPVLSPHDVRFLKAAALHDYALSALNWSRVAAAAAFSEALRADGVGRLTRLAMVGAVIIWEWE